MPIDMPSTYCVRRAQLMRDLFAIAKFLLLLSLLQEFSGGAITSRQPGHFQVSMVVKQVISCELCEGPKVKISVSQGASQGGSFLARAFDLACPGVAPPLQELSYARSSTIMQHMHVSNTWSATHATACVIFLRSANGTA